MENAYSYKLSLLYKQHIKNIFLVSPLLIYLYPVINGYLVTSEVPWVLGRYSIPLTLMNLWHLGLYIFANYAIKRNIYIFKHTTYILLILSSFFVIGNSVIKELPMISIVLPLIRLITGMAIISLAFQYHHKLSSKFIGICISLGASVILLSIVDLGLFCWVNTTRANKKTPLFGYRDTYNPSKVNSNDIVIVGDSFVWGAGVLKEERFGNRLENLLSRKEIQTKVYSLGEAGGALSAYIKSISRVPEKINVKQIILAYYLDDMPRRLLFTKQIQILLLSLKKGSLTLGLIGDLLAKQMYPDVNHYYEMVVNNYKKDEPTFKRRWDMLKAKIKRFKELSDKRSNKPPLFIILPIMVDFKNYPLEVVHRDIITIASEMGYIVIDLLPIFKDKLGDGRKYRVSFNDSHFNAYVHQIVAETIKEHLDTTSNTK